MGLQTFDTYEAMEASLPPGDTGWAGGFRLWVWDEGELTEVSVDDHPDVEELGYLYCDNEELNAGSMFDSFGPLFRIGDVYFARSHDREFEEVFRAPTLEIALDWLAPAMGVEMQLTGYTRADDPAAPKAP